MSNTSISPSASSAEWYSLPTGLPVPDGSSRLIAWSYFSGVKPLCLK